MLEVKLTHLRGVGVNYFPVWEIVSIVKQRDPLEWAKMTGRLWSEKGLLSRMQQIYMLNWRFVILHEMYSLFRPLTLQKLLLVSGFFGLILVCVVSVSAQPPVVVQPGAPGQPTKTLPASTRAKHPPTSRQDVEFMQGMIMHHAQAVEMVELIEARSQNKKVRLLGTKIANSQLDEMKFMRQWLEMRGESTEHKMPKLDASSSHSHGATSHEMLMPGMLSKAQMDALRNAKGVDFDKLFLSGMIQHHNGALVMVKELFATAGSGQDAELFNFATDVDTGQRAEIKAMETLLQVKP